MSDARNELGAFVTLLLAGGAQTQPMQFDLICRGEYREPGLGGWQVKPWERRFSVDLVASKAWVVGAKIPFDIVVTPTEIRLLWDYEGPGTTTINRTTGEFYQNDLRDIVPNVVSARCQLGEFTPPPKPLF